MAERFSIERMPTAAHNSFAARDRADQSRRTATRRAARFRPAPLFQAQKVCPTSFWRRLRLESSQPGEYDSCHRRKMSTSEGKHVSAAMLPKSSGCLPEIGKSI